MDEYSFEQKEKLARRIQKLKKEKHFADIRDIIIKYNPDINITTNPSGHFMYFQNLRNDTYFAIEKYIKKVSVIKYVSESNDTFNTENSQNDDKIVSSLSNMSEDEQFSDNPRLKYSNREKNLIKRKNYDELIKSQNNDVIEISDISESDKITESNKLQNTQNTQNTQNIIKKDNLNNLNNVNNVNNEKIFVRRKSSLKNKKDEMTDNSVTLS